uniref:Phosphoinositide phospholipase C n=1 Tax=Neobodo designis TaxID=312471 RepID=A0A7S1W9K4_NEODS|mmetsp:Transcript_8289/g.25857  ORF Transcript_8289/g.25857 Transcript_8289/m.25857 type:complete len:771 (+) Transcript_8289:230-2542(+)|eukprot:CAMPEP_0174852264 /NCGR_PEP_ID=MMETSP1114-20130205/25268_1 /TAXON_ID=312471 /ORGANISM="Neobodo designis, Strain CCAP 1951/1" /LENGTH=770 /DNA_ID=CAMNT_0016086845 /DNA_START=229 /DNA_END=2541 /DNA_ORIENTATION=-
MSERTKLKIPKVRMSPKEVHDFRENLRYDRDGLKVNKVKENGSYVEKKLFIDQHGARLFYAPTFKSVQQSSMAFRHVVEISLGKDACPGLQKCAEPGLFPITVKTAQNRYLAFLLADKNERNQLAETLAFMVRRSHNGGDEDPRHVRIYDLWIEADRDGSGTLSLTEVMRVLRKMGIALSANEVEKIFIKFDADKSGFIEYGEFVDMYGYLTQLPVLQPLFDYFHPRDSDTSLMKAAEIKDFFAQAQGESVSEQTTIPALMQFYTKKDKAEDIAGISFSNFSTFIADGQKNSWIPPSKMRTELLREDQQSNLADMDQPLHHYFIATSHNTFLLGNQVSGDASADMIGIALQEGARSIEFEIWDGPAGEPVVLRGTGLPIKARDAIHAVEENAFTTNPFPVILHLEVHCCDDQASILAHILRGAFGDALVDFNRSIERTPKQLQHKIIVCYKGDASDPDAYKSIAGCPDLEREVARLNNQSRPSHRTVGRGELVTTSGAEAVEWLPPKEAEGDEYAKVQNAVANVTILQSMDDKVLPNTAVFREAGRKTLVRICPNMGAHSDSSNVNPMEYFAAGTSMVALNYQTYDGPMRVAEAFFRQNLGCGYVPKPPRLLAPEPEGEAAAEKETYILAVTVIAGSQIPHPGNVADDDNQVIDPYVVLHVGGTPFDMENNPPLQTNVVDDNGFNPVWNQRFCFRFTDLDFATISLQVRTKASPVHKDIVHASAAVNMIRLGYRAVPLYYTHDGTLEPSAVLVCHFSLTTLSSGADEAAA